MYLTSLGLDRRVEEDVAAGRIDHDIACGDEVHVRACDVDVISSAADLKLVSAEGDKCHVSECCDCAALDVLATNTPHVVGDTAEDE